MSINKNSIFFSIIIGIALLGVGYHLLINPVGMLFRLSLTIIIFLSIGFLFYKLFSKRKYESTEMKKYNRALKQSKQKYGSQKTNKNIGKFFKWSRRRKQNEGRQRRYRRHKHLTVIKGAKSTKNSRASQ